MILNQTNINNAITQASCCMATKATKYYNGLALGKDNMCLFKEVQLLQKYIDILQCFEIIGSTTTCECSIVGEYISDGILYQFLSDGTGSYIDSLGFHSFTWSENNGILYIQLETSNINLITNGTFDSDTSGWTISNSTDWIWSSYNGGSIFYNAVDAGGSFSQNVLTVGKTYKITFDIYLQNIDDNGEGNLEISAGTSTIEVFPISAITTTETISIEKILTCTGNGIFSIATTSTQGDGYKNFYVDNIIINEIPINIQEVTFNANCDIILDNFSLPWLYSAILTITNDDYPELPITINIYNDLSILQDSIEIPPGSTPQQIVDLFNLYNEGISSGLSMEFTAPNIYTVTSSLFLSYENWSVEWLQYESLGPPPPIAYVANFEGFEELTLTNLNPCTQEVIKQTCLTNKQVTNIIKNINKICKIC